MSIGYILIMAAASVAAILITLSRMIGFHNVIKYSVLVDFAVSAILVFMFFGTFIGMMIAIIAGLMMAMFLSIVRKVYKPKQPIKPPKSNIKISIEPFIDSIRNFEFEEIEYEPTRKTEIKGSIFNR